MATATKTKSKEKIRLQPLGDRVVIERDESEDITAGGIVLPDSAQDVPARGRVLAVGDGKLTDSGSRTPLQVKINDRVIFSSYAGEKFETDGGREVLLMREDDILAVIE
jgi:chaperonin GroES